ncbi:MAG: sensor histidine kinase [Steroidobacteraceae bacterium]
MRSSRILPRSIVVQITGLLVMSVVLGVGLTAAVALYVYRGSITPMSAETLAIARAARIVAIVRRAQATTSEIQLEKLVEAARQPGIDVELLPPTPVDEARPTAGGPWPVAVRSIVDELERTWGIVPIHDRRTTGEPESIVIPIAGGRAIAFLNAGQLLRGQLIAAGVILIGAAIIAFGVLLLSTYAGRWITAPLARIAATARAFGSQPSETGTLPEDGPREIAQVAGALNEMRSRIQVLMEEQKRMLLAVSHDLRTPLARLVLRAERVPDDALREGMQRDIALVTGMLAETLAFLREGESAESARRVDLPSLLRTICGEFSDVGYEVSYEGPARLAIVCRDRASARAVTNLVDNACKHARAVAVGLQTVSAREIQISVADDGPGIPSELREKVLEPFFKVDPSRHDPQNSGFGLGLSIARDILCAHGGEIALADNARGGLTVLLRLPSGAEAISDSRVMT